MHTLDTFGLGGGYGNDPTMNYPPIFLIILRIYSRVLNLLGIDPVRGSVIVRLPSFVIDFAALLVMAFLSRRMETKRQLLFMAFFAWNPAIIYDGPVWGQIDLLHSMLMVLSLLFAELPLVSGFWLALALLTKLQAIVIVPVLGIFVLKKMFRTRNWLFPFKFLAGFAIPVSAAFAYFNAHGTLRAMIRNAYLNAIDSYPLVTMNAMNIWYYMLGTTPQTNDSAQILPHISLKLTGMILVFGAVCYASLYLLRTKHVTSPDLLKSGAFVSFSFYLLATQMHERYSIPTLVFLCVLLFFDGKWAVAAVALTVSILMNLILANYWIIGPENGMWMVYVNVMIWIWMIIQMRKVISP